ncbi:LacI family DNA-binding transcriptional regulator [Phyllobacterium sp. K27]
MSFDDGRKNRVTLLDVARKANVSRATASLVIRKSPLVSAQTRKRVEDAIQHLGYVYNMGAARMRAQRSYTIGVVVPNLTNPFFAELLAGIESTLESANMVVLLANSHEMLDRQDNIIVRMREHGVDGLIVCPAAGSDVTILQRAVEWALPLVQALRYVSPDEGDYAGADYSGGMRQAVDYLASLGHERIVFVAGGAYHSAYQERMEGFQLAMRAHGFNDENIIELPSQLSQAAEATHLLFEHEEPPTAAICFNDVVAIGLAGGLYDLGMKVGLDFSIIGFDNVAEADMVRPKLTSISTGPVGIGENAARLLLDRLADPERVYKRVVSKTSLVVRQSCGPVTFLTRS